MITEDLIKQLAPKARQEYVDALVNGSADFDAYQVNTPNRLCALLATAAHETGGFTIVRESGNYSAGLLVQVWPSHFTARTAPDYAHNEQKLFNYIYGPSTSVGKSLGNIHDGDGFAYRGGGFAQTTGRDNYARIGKAIGVDLETTPAGIEDAHISLKAALWEMAKFLPFCDRGSAGWKAVCNGINRGNALSTLDPIGWAERQQWYSRFSAALGLTQAGDDVLDYGDQGALVLALQNRLAGLGYAIGKPDGIFGSRTRAALLTFQAENDLTTDGKVGPATRAALNAETAKPMPVSEERATATVQDLRDAGSATIATTDKMKAAGVVAMVVSGAEGATQQAGVVSAPPMDLISGTKDAVTEVHSWRGVTDLMAETAAWASSHWWVAGIVLGFAYWKWARTSEMRRLLAHQLGLDLSK
jgi:putative chitinase